MLNGWVYQIDRSKIIDNFERGDIERLFKQAKLKKKPTPKKMSVPSSPMSFYDIFGDPTNLKHKTWETSETHLLIEP